MSIRESIRHLSEVIERLGIAEHASIVRSSRHLRVNITGPLGSRRAFTSATPSDYRALRNFRSDLRRLAHDVGVQTA